MTFRLKRLTKKWFEPTYDSSSILESSIDSTHDSSAFQGIDSEATHDSSGSPGIDSYRLMARAAFLEIKSNWLLTQNASPLFDSNRLMTQARNIWFWVNSWFDSEPYTCLIYTTRSQSSPLTHFVIRRFFRCWWRCSLPGCYAHKYCYAFGIP